MSVDRKQFLYEHLRPIIQSLLKDPRGVAVFGEASESYEAKHSQHGIVIKTEDGEAYFVKVQRSKWRM